jgi:hypothetical protein
MEGRQISIVFVREYRSFVAQFSKKSKEDYVLNVNKIIKEKFKTKFIVPNKVQSFLLNYEIKKLLDKAINIKNKKYKRIIYLNSNLSAIAVEKTIDFIESEYSEFGFAYILIESKSPEEEIQEVVGVTTIRV